MEFTAYELDGYMELDGKEFIEENQQLLEELGGRTAYIFPTERLADLVSRLGLESGEEFMSQDKILDRELLKYVGYTANKRDLVNALREAGIFVRYTENIDIVRDAFLRAVNNGTLTKEHMRSLFSEAGSIRYYANAIQDMIEKKVEFPITNTGGKFLWASPDPSARELAMMRITNIRPDRIDLITVTPVYSHNGTILIENPGITYHGRILTDRAGRVGDIIVMSRPSNNPPSPLGAVLTRSVGGIREAVESHIIRRAVEEISYTPSVLKGLIARYV
jgi:hypothetical protein